MPGMYAVTSIWLVRRTRAILRRAEFGFFGVMVRTCRQTPRFWGAPGIETWRCRRLFQFLRMAGALTFEILRLRPCRTSWLIVGTKTLLLSSDFGRRSAAVDRRRAAGPVVVGGVQKVGVAAGRDARANAAGLTGHERGGYQRPRARVKRGGRRDGLVSGRRDRHSRSDVTGSAGSSSSAAR